MDLFLLCWLGFAVVTAIAANARNHPPGLWFFIGLFGGVFALIAVLVMRPGAAPVADSVTTGSVGALSSDGIAEHYRGTTIRRNGDFFSVAGVVYPDLRLARQAIDLLEDGANQR
jgi:hypothetical protein